MLWARSAGLEISDQLAAPAASPHMLQYNFQPLQYFSLTQPAATVLWLFFQTSERGICFIGIYFHNSFRVGNQQTKSVPSI